jgi:hypothetical protein
LAVVISVRNGHKGDVGSSSIECPECCGFLPVQFKGQLTSDFLSVVGLNFV